MKLVLLKVALQILGQKFYKNTKKSSIYSQGLLIFIHKTQVVESHPTTREIKDLLQLRLTTTGNMVYKHLSNIAPDEDIMENNCMFIMLWNLKSH